MKLKIAFSVLGLLSMMGCQSTAISNYTYVPKKLNQSIIDELKQNLPSEHRDGTSQISLRFVEKDSYIIFTESVDDGFGYIGGGFKEKAYQSFCSNNKNAFLDYLKNNGVGIKFVFLMKEEIGKLAHGILISVFLQQKSSQFKTVS